MPQHVINVLTTGTVPRAAEVPLTPELSSYLQAQGLLDQALSFLSVTACEVTEPRLRVADATAGSVVDALLARRREETPAPQLRTEEQVARDREFLVQHGTDEQVRRFDQGTGEDALNSLLRSVLFKLFGDNFERWQYIRASEVRHTPACKPPRGGYGQVVAWSQRGRPTLDRGASEAYSLAMKLASEVSRMDIAGELPKVQLVLREHAGLCTLCKTETAEASCAIRILWNGRLLVREYALACR